MEYVKLEDVGFIGTGTTPSMKNKEFYSSKDIFFIKPSDLIDDVAEIDSSEFSISEVARSKARIFPKNTVLCVCIGSVGKIAISKIEASCNQQINYIIPNKEFSPKFIAYSLSSQKQILIDIAKEAPIVPIINKSQFQKIKIPIYSFAQQQKIATNLDKITEAISNKKKQLALFDELVKSKFVEMFGDPVTNEMGWEYKKLGELGTFKNGLNFSQDDSGFPLKYLGVADFKNNFSLSDYDLDFIKISFEPSEDYFLENEDIVFVRSNGNKELVGRCVIAYPNKTKTIFSGFCIRFRKNQTDDLNIVYLASALKTDSLKAKTVGRGANVQNLNQKILNDLQIPLPPLPLQNQFADFVQKCDRAKSTVKQEIACLQELLDSKMQEYFS